MYSKSAIIKAAIDYALLGVIYLFIAMLIFWPITINISSTVVNGGGDVFQSMWNLWWVNYAAFVLHTSIYFTNLVYFPIGASLITQTLMPLAGFFTAPIQGYGLPIAYNTLFFLGFALSGLTMFILAFYLTSNRYASFLAGIIYAFSPMHMAQSYGHLDWTSIEFIPLFVLFVIMLIREKNLKISIGYALGGAISFVLLTFFGDIEQGILSVVFTIVLLLFYLLTKERKEIINGRFLVSIIALVIFVLILGSPFFIPIFRGLTPSTLSTANELSGVQYNEIWSDNLFSFFMPSYFNAFFNANPPHFYNIVFAADPSERVSYIGYAVMLLAALGIYVDYKDHKLKNLGLWIFIAIIFGWLALGPFIQVGSLISQIPGIYYAYMLIPLFNIIREPGRFDLIVTIALAIFAAFGFKALESNAKFSSKRSKTYLLVAFTVIILIEYAGIPVSSQFINARFMHVSIPHAYYELANYTGNFTMLILPVLPNQTAPALYQGMAMYYQTAFKKPIIGGYTSRVNYSQTLSAAILPIDVAASYLESGNGLVYASPIVENYTNVTLFWLATYHVAFVSIIRQAYNQSELMQLASYLASVFGAPVYQSNTTIVFSTSAALQKSAGKSLIAYTAGTWLPGWDFCSSPVNCNATLGQLWWGNSTRAIVVYEPNATAKVRLNFQALAYGSTSLYIYEINSGQTLGASSIVSVMPLTSSLQNYSANVTLSQGINQLIFTIQPAISSPNPYINYGIMNMTLSRVQ